MLSTPFVRQILRLTRSTDLTRLSTQRVPHGAVVGVFAPQEPHALAAALLEPQPFLDPGLASSWKQMGLNGHDLPHDQ